MKGALAAALLALSACGPAERAPEAPPPASAAAPLSAPVSPSPAAAVGGLQADVSALNADISGLNVRITDTGTVVELPSDALFAFDSAALTPEAAAALAKTADLIRAGGPGDVSIVGHTDSKGDDAYNQTLSERRAEAVAAWMRAQVGVRRRGFAVSGKGEAAPVAPNTRPDGGDDPDGRARNRRVEVTIPRA